ncbi:MAG: FAD-dependent oxidoreductase [Bacilli bacterium]|nr:FAD-dependent oxidoreductase [Bacilli bacterium]
MYDIIIVGAGPAGLTSAIYARRAMKSVLVLEALSYGGQIINTLSIENYPAMPGVSGFDFATNLYNQAKDLGADIKFEKVLEIKDGSLKKVVTSKGSYECKCVIIATGCENRKLGLPLEEELTGRGISYCATCDGNFYKGKIVAVVGGGNTALEDALYLSDIASKVYLIHRREEFRGEESTLNLLKKKGNIEFILNSNVTKLVGNEKLEKIIVNDDKEMEVSGLFIAIGKIPENENFRKLIDLDDNGYIDSSEDCHTNVSGIFVAGDARKKDLRQLVTATSDGAVAANEAIKYINEEE